MGTKVWSMMPKRILITGASGFIGRNLTEYLGGKGHFLSTPSRNNIISTIRNYQPDVVFHLAAIPLVSNGNVEEVIKSNIMLTQQVCESMKAGAHLIFSSSATVYGNLVARQESNTTFPRSMYGATKLASEQIINSYVLGGKITACIARLVANVGPYASHGVLPDLIRKAKQPKDFLEVLGDCPGSSKSYLHVSDTVRALKMLLDNRAEGTYNVGSHDMATVEQIALAVVKQFDEKKILLWLGESANWVGDDNRVQLDIFKIHHDVGWLPKYKSMEAVNVAIANFKG